MSTEQAGSVVIQVTAADFMRLCENSSEWEADAEAGRFEALDSADPPSPREWRRIYWLGKDYTAVIFARAFLAARGCEYEVAFDTASDEPDGPTFGYVLLTDYEALLGERGLAMAATPDEALEQILALTRIEGEKRSDILEILRQVRTSGYHDGVREGFDQGTGRW